MEEYTEEIELSDQDSRDLAKLYALPTADEEAEAPKFHPVLEVWREILKPARTLRTEKVTPQYASKMVASYGGLSFADVRDLQDRYYDKIDDLLKILEVEIDTDDECLTWATAEEDSTENAHHYKSLLMQWQMAFLQWELDWDTTAPDAAVELAAISEVHKMFFGQQGVTAFLDNIQFEYTEADQQDLAEALSSMRGEQ